jgi:hypothetical protein
MLSKSFEANETRTFAQKMTIESTATPEIQALVESVSIV